MKGWAELYVRKGWKQKDPSKGHRHWNMAAFWETSSSLTVYDADWKNELTLTKPGFYVRSHAKGDSAVGGHNWYMTTRFDVWFEHPLDGYRWHGWLITGGDNTTFRIWRTQSSDLFRPFEFVSKDHPKRKPYVYRFKFPRIVPAEADTLAVCDGDIPKWYAKKFKDGWHYGMHPGDVLASGMLRIDVPVPLAA